MPATTPVRVFISYSSKDSAFVTQFREELKRAGVAVWLDHEQLTPGTPDWTAAVRRGIEQATDVIYAASPDAADSGYVGHELAIA
ncbi:MAG TPA: toll/interleukin-1 receptor domain-containing protein, partial [Ktedonobacterales bacterium]